MHFLLNILFPAPNFTAVEQIKFDPIVERTAELSRRQLSSIDEVWAACPYRGADIQRAVHQWKYQRVRTLHKPLVQLLCQESFPHPPGAVLCPVPLHWTRLFWRGFNQAEQLATGVGGHYGLPVEHLLKRVRPSGHQARRTRAERLMAMQNAFICSQKPVPDFVILVDDLATTGATLDACAAALKQAGVQRVVGWTVAHG